MCIKPWLVALILLAPLQALADVPPPPPPPPQPPQCHQSGYYCELQYAGRGGTWVVHKGSMTGPKVLIPVPQPQGTNPAPNDPIMGWSALLAASAVGLRLRALKRQKPLPSH